MNAASNTFEVLTQHLQQAIAHVSTGQIAEAERVYQSMLEIEPGNPEANHNLGSPDAPESRQFHGAHWNQDGDLPLTPPR